MYIMVNFTCCRMVNKLEKSTSFLCYIYPLSSCGYLRFAHLSNHNFYSNCTVSNYIYFLCFNHIFPENPKCEILLEQYLLLLMSRKLYTFSRISWYFVLIFRIALLFPSEIAIEVNSILNKSELIQHLVVSVNQFCLEMNLINTFDVDLTNNRGIIFI